MNPQNEQTHKKSSFFFFFLHFFVGKESCLINFILIFHNNNHKTKYPKCSTGNLCPNCSETCFVTCF